MSHFPKDSMSFFDTVQVFFMELTGRAIMFSGRDLELLNSWRAQGISAAIICRGLKDAIAALPQGEPPRDIYNCRAYIEPHVHNARESQVGAHEDPAASGEDAPDPASNSGPQTIVDQALANIEAAAKASDIEAVRAVYRHAWRRVAQLNEQHGADAGTHFEELAAIEEALIDGFFDVLDQVERVRIEERLLSENEAVVAKMSPAARREHLLARRRLLLIRDYGLASLVG